MHEDDAIMLEVCVTKERSECITDYLHHPSAQH